MTLRRPKLNGKNDAERRARGALDRWVVRDRKCRTLHRAVRNAEKDLRLAVTKDAWELYLVLEEHINARHVEIIGAAIRIAKKTRG